MSTVLITGSNRGIGLELARQYAAAGWQVIATCRHPEDASALRAVPGDLRIHALDVTDDAGIEALAHALRHNAIDVLINNAGVYGPRVTPYDALDTHAWLDVLRVNVIAPVKISAALCHHVERSEKKRIVAITSQMGSIADNTSGGSYLYRSSKAALNAAMRSLAIDLKPRGVAVAVIHPGWVQTDMGGKEATLNVKDSVEAIRRTIDGIGLAESGQFFNYNGRILPW